MRKLWLMLTIWAAATSMAVIAPAEDKPAAQPRNIILIGWDGAQREHVMQCLEKGELPILKQLAAEGKLVNITARGTTDTKAGWSQILTGYDPELTGVYSNQRYQPVPKGYSLFERLKTHFGADKFVAAGVIGKKAHCGEIDPPQKIEISAEEAQALKNAPPLGGKRKDVPDNREQKRSPKSRLAPGSRIVEEDGKFYRVTPGKPYLNMAAACDQWLIGLQFNARVGAKALELLEQYKDKPFFFFVHFAEVDQKGHRSGENSAEYNDALISSDTWTGNIIRKLKDLNLYGQTVIYVTADHGFDEDKTSHNNAPFVFLATNDPQVCRDGDRADIAPTIYDRFGLDVTGFDPPLSGHSLLKPLETKPGK